MVEGVFQHPASVLSYESIAKILAGVYLHETLMEVTMAIGRPIPPLHLSSDERESLERWKRRPTTAQALALRSRIILRCSEGKTNTVVAGEMVWPKRWGSGGARFIERRLDGLLDEPRPGGPRSHTDVERVVTLTLETTPADATHWSTRSMAARTGLSQSAISRIKRAFALQASDRDVQTFV